MSPTALLSVPEMPQAILFDLDVRTVELAGVATQINLTDDNCGGTCSGTACNSAV